MNNVRLNEGKYPTSLNPEMLITLEFAGIPSSYQNSYGILGATAYNTNILLNKIPLETIKANQTKKINVTQTFLAAKVASDTNGSIIGEKLARQILDGATSVSLSPIF